jgi:hypothetical protein
MKSKVNIIYQNAQWYLLSKQSVENFIKNSSQKVFYSIHNICISKKLIISV